jgi:2-polyprenyl-3-methyl-5-hydroxy-6-metoxy-1,4-benzoquinol methylase
MNPFFKKLSPYIKNKECLDIGAVQHDINRAESRGDTWVHGFIKSESTKCIGVDIEKEQIDAINKRYNTDIRYGDAEDLNLNSTFDVVFAGDIIEHLSNQGKLIESAIKHMNSSGVLILTTPNAFGLHRIIRDCLFGINSDPVCHVQHTLWHSPSTIKSLIKRYKLDLIEIDYYSYNKFINLFFHFIGKEDVLPHMIIVVKNTHSCKDIV